MHRPILLMLSQNAELVNCDGYKTMCEAIDMFNKRHPEKQFHHSMVSRILKDFKQTGSLGNNCNKESTNTLCTQENQLALLQVVIENPKISILY